MKKTFFLILFTSIFTVQAQKIEAVSRYSYYTHETKAAILVFGPDIELVEQVYVENQVLTRIAQTLEYQEFEWRLGTLPLGTTPLNIQVLLKNGQRITQSIEITRLEPKPNEVKIDRITGGLLVNQLPFFPFGFYASSPVGDIAQQEVYNAMNLIGVYQTNDDETLAERKAYMDECARLGMKVNYGVNGLVGGGHNRPDLSISPEEEARRWTILRKEVETFRDHPALLSWYMNDEPDGQSRPPALLEKAYQIIREVDPYHPVTVVFVIPEKASLFASSHDIAMTDPYPIPGDVDAVRAYMRPLNEYFRFKKPLWLVPQAFGGGEFWLREPTADEIRVMTYLGLIENAMGVQYFIRQYPNIRPQSRVTWNGAVAVAHETAMLYPWLFSTKQRIAIETNVPTVSGKVFDDGESLLVLLANTQNQPAQLQFKVPSTRNATAVQVLFENRSIPVVDGQIQDVIMGYGTKAYRIDFTTPPTQTKNLFVNPGFESFFSPAAPYGLYLSTSKRPAYNGTTLFLTAETSHTGRYALRLRNPDDQLSQKLTFFRMMVQQNQSYLIQFYAKGTTSQKPAKLQVMIEDLAWKQTIALDSTWKAFSFWVPVDKSIAEMQLGFETIGEGTIWLDDVTVVQEPSFDVAMLPDKSAALRITANLPDVSVRVTTLASPKDNDFRPYKGPITTRQNVTYQVGLFKNGQRIQTIPVEIPLSQATFGELQLDTPNSPKYAGRGPKTLTDGQFAPLDFKDKGWLGFDGKDVVFILKLDKPTSISTAKIHYLVSVSDGIHAPLALQVDTSSDGRRFEPLGATENITGSKHGPAHYQELAVKGTKRMAHQLRFTIKSPKIIGPSFLFAGTNAWIFLDEVLAF